MNFNGNRQSLNYLFFIFPCMFIIIIIITFSCFYAVEWGFTKRHLIFFKKKITASRAGFKLIIDYISNYVFYYFLLFLQQREHALN